MQIFKPKLDFKSYGKVYLWISPLFFLFLALERDFWKSIQFLLIQYGIITLVFLIIQWTTRYRLFEGKIYYRSFFLFGSIRIKDIHKIEVGRTLWVGMKPATAEHGIIVYYNRYDEIYFSPQSNQEMVDALLEINPDISVNYTSSG
ncbi:PH domain-containing protein [Sphingobacterium sp. HJSM2_6]|uniref:PH domain-containing protein n=1 Tax=Sphingobacterium sp. HJSM2_6 TaxID=3366264 RepID=UPI003BC41C68